jgi:hypothetical protein
MTDQMTGTLIAFAILIGFFAVVLAVLLGFVDVKEPSIAKLVGMVFGYLTALLNPVVFRYFGPAKE